MMPRKPMNSAVMAPITMTKDSAVCDISNSGDMRATMKMPAVTMVAAWISAEIGVGPSIESGSHTCSGTCADLPMAPMNSQMQMKLMTCTFQPPKPSQPMAGMSSNGSAGMAVALANTTL